MKKEIFGTGCFYVNNQIFDAELSANAKLVYIYLAKCADAFGKSWPAHKTIAAACSLSVSTVKFALQELKECGIVTISKRYRAEGGKSSNLYMLMDRSKESSFSTSPMIFTKALSSKAKLVYFFFCRCADKLGNCFPAHKTTAQRCSMGFSTVRKALAELLDAAVICATKRLRADEGQTSNLYSLQQIVSEAVETVKTAIQNWKDGAVESVNLEKSKPAPMKKSIYSWMKRHVSFFRAGSIDNIEQPPCSLAPMKELNPSEVF